MVGSGSDTFYVLDRQVIENVYQEWTDTLPKVKPYYAVKCNPNPDILRWLADLGSNFDCASPAEIQAVLALGVEPERILYANPCKRREDICFAKDVKVLRTTFDSVCELKKISRAFEGALERPELLLRIRADDPSARCNLGVKYGAPEHEWDILFLTAKILGLDLIGISFHVGSFASSSSVFSDALGKAERAIELARKNGFDPRIIDIGGGFSSVHGLPKNLKCPPGLELIAEPGRFFVERAMTLYTPIIGVKGSGLTISESLYGSFNCILFDHAQPQIKEFLDEFGNKIEEGSTRLTTIFGSTCDGADIIYKEYPMPVELDEGNWIVWENMGAYTLAATTKFNGISFDNRRIDIV